MIITDRHSGMQVQTCPTVDLFPFSAVRNIIYGYISLLFQSLKIWFICSKNTEFKFCLGKHTHTHTHTHRHMHTHTHTHTHTHHSTYWCQTCILNVCSNVNVYIELLLFYLMLNILSMYESIKWNFSEHLHTSTIYKLAWKC